ncbi:hypothetical protein BH11GEM1_BH11GEM1_31380 [soil metagenome]
MTALEPLPVRFDRETCGELERVEAHEWLVTNGIGGFASGPVAGIRWRADETPRSAAIASCALTRPFA